MERPSHCTISGRDPRMRRPLRRLLSRLAAFLIGLVIVSLMFTGEHWLLLEAPAAAAGLPAPFHAASSD